MSDHPTGYTTPTIAKQAKEAGRITGTYRSAADGLPPPPVAPALRDMVSQIQEALHFLDEQLSCLEKRLEPVLKQPANKLIEAPDFPANTALGVELAQIASKVLQMRNATASILERVDL